MKELPEEARLAHPRFPDHGDDLAAPPTRPIEGVPELLKLRVSADEACEAPACRYLEAGAGGAGSHQLEYLDWVSEPVDRNRTERGAPEEAPGQGERLGGAAAA